ncbi:molybdenum cofactor guanylyltransferase [Conexibacter sp. SYSU D00693]|uniref:molybdenum cofactor guanylyltransferase n=1 Tax=Conexibacter sp. SYSU D00693 TaxID=2812560 RepID=UPI00196A5A81|nr:NTP transferase domain-containing protein [Conexibacter sp. SYSU D00693]
MALGTARAPLGAVLAGGAGRRIGGDKAVVELHGRPLLHYALDVLSAVVDDVVVVAKRATRLPPVAGRADVWVEPDEPRHPLCGVVHAIKLARGRPVLLVAGDLPLLDQATLRALLRADAGGRAAAVVAQADGRLQPLCALYRPRALAGLEGFDATTRTQEVVAALDPVVVDLPDGRVLHNVNAPEDLLHASALMPPPARGTRRRGPIRG